MSTFRINVERAAMALDMVRSVHVGAEPHDWANAELMTQISHVGTLRQACDALLVTLTAELDARSPRDDSARNLARQAGFACPTMLLAETAGINPAESAKIGRVAAVTVTRPNAFGEAAAAQFQHVQAAFAAGALTTEQVDAIAKTLGEPSATENPEAREQVELALVELAPTVRLNDLKKACDYSRTVLSPDSREATEAQMRAARSLRFVKKLNGMAELVWLMTPEEESLVRAGIDAGARALGRGSSGPQPEISQGKPTEGSKFDMSGNPLNPGAVQLTQLRADAAFAIFDHAAGCTSTDPKMPSFHAVVRVDLDTLRNGVGVAELDGVITSASAGLARRIAAKAGIIPAVMGSSDVPLNLGMKTRLFSPSQRLALINRDGACAWPGCESTPQFADAHHIAWWAKDDGPTDLSNGIMLCSSHHHRVHDNGWQIEFAPPPGDATGSPIPWFIPPPEWVAADPHHRTRLQGGNANLLFDRALGRAQALASASLVAA